MLNSLQKGNRNMNITFDTGNFTLAVSGTVKPEKLDKLAASGLRWELERSVVGAVYKELAGVAGKRGKVLPKGYKRDSLTFTEENASKFEGAAFDELKATLDGLSVKVTKYVPPVGTIRKDVEEVMVKHESKGDLEAWLATLGYEGDSHGEDGEYAESACVAVSKYLTARFAAILAASKADA